MYRSSIVNTKISARGAVAAAFSVLLVVSLSSSPVVAQTHCTEWTDRLLDTSDNCVNEPFRDRAKNVETFRWKGHDYMIFSGGNELFLYNIDSPANPILVDESFFNFGTRGDSDYDLLRFDVADEGRFLVMAHKLRRTVVVDLGGGGVPVFGNYATYEASDNMMGGFTFNKGGVNYLLAGGLDGGCATGSGLYLINSPSNLDLMYCLDVGGAPITVRGLQLYDAPSGYFLYAGVNGGIVHVFQTSGSGLGLTLDYKSSPAGMLGARYQLSVDENNARAASSDFFGGLVSIWDLSSPGFPSLDYTISATVDTISLRSPSANTASTLFGITDGAPRSTRTWEVGPSTADEFEATFWSDPTLPHNVGPSCIFPVSGALSLDGSALYLSRQATHDVFDLSECLEPTPAVADVSVTPSPVFPGRPVEVRDVSTGRIDEWALWITRNSTIVAGTDILNNSNPRTINFTIPQNLPLTDNYTAHVEVDSSELTPADPYDQQTIVIDRTPTASFTISPEAVIVGDTVTLSASAEGVVASGGYHWVITGPSGSPVNKTGATVNHTIGASDGGTWTFKLTAQYNHGASGITDPGDGTRYGDLDSDSLYEFEITETLDVSSVAADFTITPASPLHTQSITLNASTSKPSGATLAYQWEVVSNNPPHAYTSCPAQIQCVIPGDSLNPDASYSVTLTVWNGPDSSTKTKWMLVGNGNIQPTISWVPTSPEIGDNVLFSINGVPADIDSASWNMGGGGCEGADSTPTCTPSLWNNCKTQAYSYNSSGSKTVSLSIVVGENTFTAPPATVLVQSAGSCDSSPPPPGTCDYTLGRSSITFGPNGGTTSFSVSTTSSCTWVANTTSSWITILSPSGQISGPGTVTIRADANDGPQRTGNVLVGGKVVQVTQEAPYVPANFTMSNPFPEIGQTVTFSVDPILQVVTWNFGQADCRGNAPNIDCSYLPAGTCNTFQWSYPDEGPKQITMVLSDGRTQTKTATVKPTGQCCLVDGRPDASFEMSADEVFVGETVTFTDTSVKLASFATKALGFGWVPENPEIGEAVTFTLSGVVGDIEQATWSFGEIGCEGAPAVQDCVPNLWNDCSAITFAFASSGLKEVSVDVRIDGDTQTVGPSSVDVANAGSCDGGGGGGCSYSLSSSTASFPFEGGDGSFNVNTTAECEWDATTTASWLDLGSASGVGPGTVSYTVSANESPATRSGIIWVEGRTHRVSQDGDRGDTAPSRWEWSITRIEDEEGEPVDEDVYSSTDPNTSYTFELPGYYRVRLTASNCFGDDFRVDYVRVFDSPIEDFVVGAAVSLAGANNTQWESDFRFYNPCGEDLDVRIEYQPENTNNAGAELVFREFQLLPNETRVFGHITDAIPGLIGETISGSVRIESQSDSGCKVLSVSRTFNDTPGGSLGLFVPALPVKRVGLEFLDLTGLIHDSSYRTNLRLVNYADEDVWVPLSAYDRNGDQVGQQRSVNVRGQSTKQINEIAPWLGVTEDLAPFSVRAEIEGLDVQAFATVVDNLTGDSVLYLSSFHNEQQIWLVGVASLSGVNDSQWRTDLWLYNPTGDWLPGEIEFVVGDNPSDSYGFEWPTLGTHRTKQYLDIVSDELGLSETRGYIVLTGADGGSAPQVSARTYNLDPSGGTYGLNLRAYGSKDLLQPGETGYIAGISNSSDQSVGFRTNFGVLNTDRSGWTTVRITMFNLDGTPAADPDEFTIAPGKLRQFDVFRRLGLDGVDMTGSLVVEAVSGGAIAVYATEIDNRTQDSIFIPAQRLIMGLAR